MRVQRIGGASFVFGPIEFLVFVFGKRGLSPDMFIETVFGCCLGFGKRYDVGHQGSLIVERGAYRACAALVLLAKDLISKPQSNDGV